MESNSTFIEICRNSAVIAVSALSKLLSRQIGMNLNINNITEHNDEIKLLPGLDSIQTAIFIPIVGTLRGNFLFQMNYENALKFSDILLHREEGTTQVLNELEISALSKMANITIGNFLTPFANSLNIDLFSHQISLFDSAPFSQIQDRFSSVEFSDAQIVCINLNFNYNKIAGQIKLLLENEPI